MKRNLNLVVCFHNIHLFYFFQDIKAEPSKIDLQRQLAEKQMQIFAKQEALIDIQTQYYKAKLAILQSHGQASEDASESPKHQSN